MTPSRNTVARLVALLGVLGIAGLLIIWYPRPSAQVIPAAPEEISRRDLVMNDGRWYRTGETNVFSGWMVDLYPDGARLSRSQISSGLLNGVSETWYPNGRMQVREYFKDNISSGLREKWHENGAKQSQATIVDGQVVGTFQSWYDNGQLAEQIEMKLGQPDGVALAYYPSGFLKVETTVRDGQVLGRKLWKDGEYRQVAAVPATAATPDRN